MTATTNRTILITPVNMMGYTAESQAYVISNGSSDMETFKFLRSIARHFEDFGSLGKGVSGATRQNAFIRFCTKNGFKVKVAWGR